MGKKSSSHPSLLLVFAVLLTFILIIGGIFLVQPVNPKNFTKIPFIVQRGESATQVGLNLERHGLIRNSFAFRVLTILKHLSQKIEAGEYELSPSMNLFETANSLKKGVIDIWVTLPEGMRKEEIAINLGQVLVGFKANEFLKLTINPNLEGRLFPDTYLLPKTAPAQFVIDKLTGTFDKKTKSIFDSRANDLSVAQTLVLASIIEREVRTNPDRQIIAGILIKRLENGWSLDIDATLQYAKSSSLCLKEGEIKAFDCKWWQPAISVDKNLKSSFNTYKNQGLPPAPIANPGIKAIEAASHPQRSDYWFYLSDLKGVIHYAKTLEEHQRNITAFLGNP